MLKPNDVKVARSIEAAELVAEFLRAGGKIARAEKLAIPKDLRSMKRTGWMFGGRRTFVATVHERQEHAKGEMFGGSIAKPMARGRKIAYDFA